MDTTIEIASVIPSEDFLHSDNIHNVMMQPVQANDKSCTSLSRILKSFKCDICGKLFTLASRLKLHAKTHSSNSTGRKLRKQTSISNTTESTVPGFKLNKKNLKNKDSSPKTKSNVEVASKKMIENDTSLQSGNGTTAKLFNDELQFSTNVELENNVNQRKSQSKDNKTRSKDNQIKSKGSKNKTLNYKCKFCHKKFATPAHLSRHIPVHTGVRCFKCEKCNKTFKDSSVLTRHLGIHSNDRSYSCKLCDKSFIQNKDLQHHLRSHNDERPYQCETCNKYFTSASYLTVHKRTHAGIKPYVCSVCNAGFYASGTLARHQRTHSDEKQYKCSECPKAFTRSTNLKLHIKAHHSKK